MLRDLTGQSKNPLRWADETSDSPTTPDDMSQTYRFLWIYLTRTQVAYYLGEVGLAHRMLKNLNRYITADPSFFSTTIHIFFSGLIATGMFRETKKMKYKSFARKATDQMKKLMKNKGLNNLHK
jgi:hypothetical protein